MLWKVKLNPEDMLSLERSRAADASLNIEEKNHICQKLEWWDPKKHG